MKKQPRYLLPAALISLLFVVSALPSALPRETCDHSKWLQASLEEIEAIRAGMTRRDLMKSFRAQGGIFTRTQQQFVYRKSPLIHVTVKFEAVGRPDITAPEQSDVGDDTILEISRPFIENEILD